MSLCESQNERTVQDPRYSSGLPRGDPVDRNGALATGGRRSTELRDVAMAALRLGGAGGTEHARSVFGPPWRVLADPCASAGPAGGRPVRRHQYDGWRWGLAP